MTRITSKKLLQLIAVLSMMLTTATSQAGILNGHVDAYGGWTGSVPFDNLNGLSGTVDYAVFTAADFNANFSGMGYIPGDLLVYTYQVNVDSGSLFVSSYTVEIDNPANTIGTFGPLNGTDVDASSSSFDFADNAEWFFLPNEIPDGASSYGLAYSSPNIPMAGGAVIVDGGTAAFAIGVPAPSAVVLPEPSSCVLFAGCLVALVSRRAIGK